MKVMLLFLHDTVCFVVLCVSLALSLCFLSNRDIKLFSHTF